MKILNAILVVLLLVAIGMIVKLKKEQVALPPVLPAPSTPITAAPKDSVVLVLHLDDPAATLQRFYELFPGAIIDEVDIGNNKPNSPLAKKIKKELGLPLISGKKTFPRALLDKLVAENKDGQFIHFSNIRIGASSLGIGSKQSTPTCTFPSINSVTGTPIYAQVIPWIKLNSNSKPYFDNAVKLGFLPCDTFIQSRKEGYVIDPQGFLTLLQQAE